MLKNRRTSLQAAPKSLLLTILVSALITVLVSFIFAVIANSGENSTSSLGVYSLISLLISAAVGGLFSTRICGFKIVVLSALSMILLMLIFAFIVCGGKVTLGAFMNYGCYFGAYVAMGYLGKKRERRRRIRRH